MMKVMEIMLDLSSVDIVDFNPTIQEIAEN